MDKLAEGRKVFDLEINALQKLRDVLDETFVKIVDLIVECKGKVIITGIGKSGHIAKKIAASMASLGTPAFYLHPSEAMHGDLGMVEEQDVVIAISYSGESGEIIHIIPNIKIIGATLVGITGNAESTLARASDVVQIFPSFLEACHLGLAPTSSTTAALVYGDALAVTASVIYGFADDDFGKFHPAGALGKRIILRVKDLMSKDENNSIVYVGTSLKDAIVELSKKGLGIVSVVDKDGKLLGIITDGDLRRQFERVADIYSLKVENIMTVNPIIVNSDVLAIDALKIMKKKRISCMPVVLEGKAVGIIRINDIIGQGIIG